MHFTFENLKVYKASIDFNEQIHKILETLSGKIPRSLRDQLQRASVSISLNIAEGNGRWHKAEKRQFFWIARGSTFECVAILDIMFRSKLICQNLRANLYEKLVEISKMIAGLIKAVPDLQSKV